MKKLAFFIMMVLCLGTKSIISQDTIILRPGPEGKDADINSIFPDNNYLNSFKFKSMAWTHSGVPGQHRGLIDFDLSFISPESTILEARLSLYFGTFEIQYLPHTGQNASYLLKITEPWEEDEVTWNNQPATTMENMVILHHSTYPEQDYPDIDVTELVRMMVSDPDNNHGLMIRLITEQHYRCLLFASGDCDVPEKRPRLEIIYMDCVAPEVDFDYQVDGQTVSFTGISANGNEWLWDFGDGDTSSFQNPEHVYEHMGTYPVCLRVKNSCDFTLYCKDVFLCSTPPESGFIYTSDSLSVLFQNTSIMATAYYWDFGDGSFSNLSNPMHTYDSPGYYLVCLETRNGCGSDTACEMLDLSAVYIPENNAGLFTIYPNPAREVALITSAFTGQVHISLLDLSGKEVIKQNMDIAADETIKMPLGQIEPGLYIVRISSGKEMAYGKLVVVKISNTCQY